MARQHKGKTALRFLFVGRVENEEQLFDSGNKPGTRHLDSDPRLISSGIRRTSRAMRAVRNTLMMRATRSTEAPPATPAPPPPVTVYLGRRGLGQS